MKNSDRKTHKELVNKGWSMLEQDLDAVLPVERRRRFIIWWWLFPLLFAGALGTWWFLGDRGGDRSNHTAKQPFMAENLEEHTAEIAESENIASTRASRIEHDENTYRDKRESRQSEDQLKNNESQNNSVQKTQVTSPSFKQDVLATLNPPTVLQSGRSEKSKQNQVITSSGDQRLVEQEDITHDLGQDVTGKLNLVSDPSEEKYSAVQEPGQNDHSLAAERRSSLLGILDYLEILPIKLQGSEISLHYDPLVYESDRQVMVSKTDREWILAARTSVADDPSSPGWGLGISSAYSWNDRWQFSFGLEYVHVRLKDNISEIEVPQEYALVDGFEAVNNVAASNKLGEYDWLINYSALYFPVKLDYIFRRKLGVGMAIRPGLILDNKLEILEFPDQSRLHVEEFVHTDLKNQFDFQLSPSISWYVNRALSVSAFWEIGMIQFNASGQKSNLDFINNPLGGNRERDAQYFQTNNLGLRINWHF